mgnify:CR=1 FL=1
MKVIFFNDDFVAACTNIFNVQPTTLDEVDLHLSHYSLPTTHYPLPKALIKKKAISQETAFQKKYLTGITFSFPERLRKCIYLQHCRISIR